MAIFEVTESGLEPHTPAQFAGLGLYERQDLQRLLRAQPTALGEDLYVVAEEFGQWADARRRIDLLAVDKAGHLVVIELKRTDDGGHMELQSLRYAAMVASITFDELAEAHAAYLARQDSGATVDARAALLEFLEADDGEEPSLSNDVRIVLVSADFSREITTTVLWLNRFDGMDIRCVRLVPYKIDNRVLLDIQQVIPLPEAQDYQVRMRRKDAARERKATESGRDLTRYQILIDGIPGPDLNKRRAILEMVTQLTNRGVRPSQIAALLPARVLPVVDGLVTGPDEVEKALAARYPGIDLRRHWTGEAFPDETDNSTYVILELYPLSLYGYLQKFGFPAEELAFREREPTDRNVVSALKESVDYWAPYARTGFN